ncbi:MAG TPA: hypothetical protein VKM94_14755 [Blastocatellia bacterium]|nr:hypothetical protein [Blastocatellia bacterium]
MGITRRKFVEVGTAAGLCAVLPLRNALAQSSQPTRGTGLFQIPKAVTSDPVFFLTKAAFANRINDPFTIQLETYKLQLNLAEIRDSGPRPATTVPGKECFLLLFRGSRASVLPQGTYMMTHSRMGTFSLFLSKQKSDASYQYYEAIINHLYP